MTVSVISRLRLEALIPRDDAPAVRQALRHQGWDWTESCVHGGWTGRRYTRFWLMIHSDQLETVRTVITQAAPPRQVWYQPRHAWAIDAWLHPTPITLQGAILTWWPVTMPAPASS